MASLKNLTKDDLNDLIMWEGSASYKVIKKILSADEEIRNKGMRSFIENNDFNAIAKKAVVNDSLRVAYENILKLPTLAEKEKDVRSKTSSTGAIEAGSGLQFIE